jgi:hypothetical protein
MKIGTVQFEIDSTKIVETESELIIPGKIARECVLPYSEGKAYRPKDELHKSLFTFDGAWIVSGKHPDQMLVSKPAEISGRLMNVTWDEKEALVSGEAHLFKDRNTPQFLADVKSGKLKDVSIGFIYAEDWTPGEFKGEKYDFVQRDIVINHVAVGVPRGRCPSPLCGLTVDMAQIKIALDPWEETENSIRSGHGDKTRADTCRTKVINEGLSLVVCKDKETGKWFDQSFIFKKDQGWTMQKAKEWFSKHNVDSLQLITQLALETMLYDAMTPEEIDAKIAQLEKDRDAFRQQVEDHYTEQRKKNAKLQEKIDAVNRKRSEEITAIYASAQSPTDEKKLKELYDNMDALNVEIQQFREAKVQTVVAGNEAEWNPSADWPDSCFGYVPESAKGPDGKKSDRKIPYKWPDGTPGPLNIIRNALARLAQEKTDIPDAEKARITKMLQGIVKKANPDYKPSTDSILGEPQENVDAEELITTSKRLRDLSQRLS